MANYSLSCLGDTYTSRVADTITRDFGAALDGGTYALTGNDIGLRCARMLACAGGSLALTGNVGLLGTAATFNGSSYALTGVAATLTVKHGLVCASGSLTLTGEATALSYGFSLTVDGSSYALTGNAAGLTSARRLDCALGSLTLTGAAAPLIYGVALTMGRASYSLSTTAATLRSAHVLPGATGSLTLSGAATAFNFDRRIAANSGTGAPSSTNYQLVGKALSFRRTRVVPFAAGSLALNGGPNSGAAVLRAGRRLALSSGSYQVIGEVVARDFSLPCTTGSYGQTGNTVAPLLAHRIVVASPLYSLTIEPVTLVHGHPLVGVRGNYVLNGIAMVPKKSAAKVLTCDVGLLALTGNDTSFGLRFPQLAGSFALTGRAVTLARGKAVACANGSYVVNGPNQITRDLGLTVDGAQYALTGTAAIFVKPILTCAPGVYTLTGSALATRLLKLTCDSAAYALSGASCGFRHAYAVSPDLGTYDLVGATSDRTFEFICDSGSYSLNGIAAAMVGRGLTAAVGSYALKINDQVTRDFGAGLGGQGYALTGYNLAFNKKGQYALNLESGAYDLSIMQSQRDLSLVSGRGNFAVTGAAAVLRYGVIFSADSGAYALLGSVSQRDFEIAGGPGALSLTGPVVTLRRALTLVPASGIYNLTGQVSSRKFTLPALSSDYSVTGFALGYRAARALVLVNGNFVLSGAQIGFGSRGAVVFPANTGTIALIGGPLGFRFLHRIVPSVGTYALTGQDVARGFTTLVSIGNYAVTIVPIAYRRRLALTAGVAAYSLSGSAASPRLGSVVSIQSGSATLSSNVPTVTVTFDHFRIISAAQLAITATPPAAFASLHHPIVVPSSNLDVATLVPQLVVGPVEYSVSGQLLLTGYSPVLSTSHTHHWLRRTSLRGSRSREEVLRGSFVVRDRLRAS